MKYVTLHLKHKGVGLGKLDKQGRLIWSAGHFTPVKDPDRRDKELRRNVVRISKDDGCGYKKILKGLALPPAYKASIKACKRIK